MKIIPLSSKTGSGLERGSRRKEREKKKSIFTILQEVVHQKAKARRGLRTNMLLLFWFSEIRSASTVQAELELTVYAAQDNLELMVVFAPWPQSSGMLV